MRDRFVVGFLDMGLPDKLSRNPKLTLHEALIEARQHEDAEREKSQLTASAQLVPVDLDATRSRQTKLGDKHSGRREFSERRGTKSVSCDFCGKGPHQRQDCPARKQPATIVAKRVTLRQYAMLRRKLHTRSSSMSLPWKGRRRNPKCHQSINLQPKRCRCNK